METLWFCLAAFSLAGYVVLDGFDLGAGIIHLFAARTNEQRRLLLASIGPFWDANEVWLPASGGTIYFAFPSLYASSFSGFYLPLMIVLWLLILRGIAIEFRNHIESAVWTPLWDVVFSGASGLLAIFLGAAIGNVVRGVPLDHNGEFFLPLWGEMGILEPYTIATGLFAFSALMLLSIHDQFRAASNHLVHLVADDRGTAAIRPLFSRLAEVLHHHHHVEEVMVFPLIRRLTGVAPEQLQVDHDEMTAAIEAVETRLGAHDGTRVGEAITRFHEILVTHLDREEALVIPVFLELAPDELWQQLHSS